MKFFKNPFGKREVPLQVYYDDKGHSLPYALQTAKNRNSPLLVILHGNGSNKNPSKFHSDNYHVLCPLDRYGIKNNGCWFLGEKGDFFLLRLLTRLIDSLPPELTRHGLYFWGSSMGGFAAILLGLLLKARAVCAHIPQTNLFDSHWYMKNRPFIDLIFGDDQNSHPYRNIPGLLAGHLGYFPLFFLSFNRFDRPHYLEEHLHPLQNTLDQLEKNYFLLIHPQSGHAIHQTVAQQVAWFALYQKEIEENWQAQAEKMPLKEVR